MKIRGFELISSFTDETLLPKRETAHTGYDLKVAERTVIAPGKSSSCQLGSRPICNRLRCSISMTVPLTLVKRSGLDQLCWGYRWRLLRQSRK